MLTLCKTSFGSQANR